MKYTCCPADWTKLSNTRKSTSKYWVKESETIPIQNIPEEKEPMQQQRRKMKPFWLLNETGPNPSLSNAGIICWKLILANKQPLVQCPQSNININIGRNILRRSAHRRLLSSLPRLGWRGHTWPNTGQGDTLSNHLLPDSSPHREFMMGEGNRVAIVIMSTFTKRPGPHAHG